MKSLIKKAFVVFLVLATFVDWPVDINASAGTAVVKSCSRSAAFKSCIKEATIAAEKFGNKSTKITEEAVEGAAKSNYTRLGIMKASQQLPKQAVGSNARSKTGQIRVTSCPRCYGQGCIQGSDGYTYTCNRCNGSGRIVTKKLY